MGGIFMSHAHVLKQQLQSAIQKDCQQFEKFYAWMIDHMPPRFFEEVDEESISLIVHSLMGLNLSDYLSHIHMKERAFVLCLDNPEADINVLKKYRMYNIKSYAAFISNTPPPFENARAALRVTHILLRDTAEGGQEERFTPEKKQEISAAVKELNAQVTSAEIDALLTQLSPTFVRNFTKERLALLLDMFFRAQLCDTI